MSDSDVDFRKVDGGMWLSKRAWGVLSEMLDDAEYARDGGIVRPLTEHEVSLCMLIDMLEASGLQMAKRC